jgi:hypothetical protein
MPIRYHQDGGRFQNQGDIDRPSQTKGIDHFK